LNPFFSPFVGLFSLFLPFLLVPGASFPPQTMFAGAVNAAVGLFTSRLTPSAFFHLPPKV
jgi:hypothetical protein